MPRMPRMPCADVRIDDSQSLMKGPKRMKEMNEGVGIQGRTIYYRTLCYR